MARTFFIFAVLMVGGFAICAVARTAAQEDSPQAATPGIHAFGFQILSGADAKAMGPIGKIEFAVRQRWFADPRLHEKLEEYVAATVDFTVDRYGKVESVKLQRSSGDAMLDEAAISAVNDSSPFANIASDFKGAKLRNIFTYNLPSGPSRPVCEGFHASTSKKAGGKVSPPRTVQAPDPPFSEEARKHKYQGTMQLRVTVEPDGTAKDICIEQGLGMGLDENAIETLKTWRFKPATEDGQAVPVRIAVEVDYRLY